MAKRLETRTCDRTFVGLNPWTKRRFERGMWSVFAFTMDVLKELDSRLVQQLFSSGHLRYYSQKLHTTHQRFFPQTTIQKINAWLTGGLNLDCHHIDHRRVGLHLYHQHRGPFNKTSQIPDCSLGFSLQQPTASSRYHSRVWLYMTRSNSEEQLPQELRQNQNVNCK